jgi:hypothetical protein
VILEHESGCDHCKDKVEDISVDKSGSNTSTSETELQAQNQTVQVSYKLYNGWK